MTKRMPGFFDVEERLRELSAKGDDLERVKALVDFEIFRPSDAEPSNLRNCFRRCSGSHRQTKRRRRNLGQCEDAILARFRRARSSVPRTELFARVVQGTDRFAHMRLSGRPTRPRWPARRKTNCRVFNGLLAPERPAPLPISPEFSERVHRDERL